MASAVLRSSENYIKLLLETNKDQAKVLLAHATPKQVEAISEIAFNLLHLSLSNRIKRVVEKVKHLLKRLTKKAVSFKAKISLLKRNAHTVLKLLKLIKDSLLQLL